MTDLPDGTLYGRLTGRVGAFIGDTPGDENDLPDRVPTAGRVTVTPSITHVIHKPTGDVIFATPDPIDLDDDGHFEVTLVAVDSPDLNPTGWYYTVRVDVPGRAALTAQVQIFEGQTITLGEAIGAAQPGVSTAVVKGDRGARGPKGEPGRDGIDGRSPEVTMTGDQLVIDGVIVGPHLTGPAGPPSKLTVGAVATGAPGSQADASITGTSPSQVLNLTLPKGDPGAPGKDGPAGAPGSPGKDGVSPPAPVFTASASTLSAGSAATAAVSGTYPNLALTFGIPRGADGAAGSGTGQTAYEMRGTGSPYGVITPPAAGVYYTDTAGTMGAWRWIATGTTSTSWVVQHGDTGWRDISSLLINEWVASTAYGAPCLRRIGSIIYTRGGIKNGTSSQALKPIPAGFGTTGFLIVPTFTTDAGFQNLNISRSYVIDAVPGSGENLLGGSWPAGGPWPSTLPGTPA